MYSAGLRHRQWTVLLDQAGQISPLDVFHDQQVGAANLVGIVGQHDVGVRQGRRRPDLAFEAAHGIGVGQPLLADQLQGDDMAQLPVAGLEDLAHAPLAQPLQQHVGPQQQFLASSLEQLVGLVRSQPATPDQFPGEGLRVGKAALEVLQFVQLGRFQQPVLAKGVHQGSSRGNNHDSDPEREQSAGSPPGSDFTSVVCLKPPHNRKEPSRVLKAARMAQLARQLSGGLRQKEAKRRWDVGVDNGGRLVTKKDMAKAIAEEMGLTQLQAQEIVQKVFDGITETLVQEGRLELRNFGVFEVKKRQPRKARNPRTGEKVKVPAKLVVAFKPGREMEERVGQLKHLPNV